MIYLIFKQTTVLLFSFLIIMLKATAAQAQEVTLHGQWVAVDGVMYDVPISDASLPLLRFTFGEKEAKWTLPAHPQTFRYTVYGEGAPDSLDFHLPTDGPQTWLVPVRSQLRGDTLEVAFPITEPFDSAGGAPPARPKELRPDEPMEFLRLSLVRQSMALPTASKLTGEESEAAVAIEAEDIERMTRALVAPEMEGRGSGQPGGERAALAIEEWFDKAGLEPLGDQGFLQEIPLFVGQASSASSLTVGDTTFQVGSDFAIATLPMRTRPDMSLDIKGEVVLFGPSLGHAPADVPLPELDVEGKIVAWIASSGPGDGSGADIIRTYEALYRSGAEAFIALFPGPLPEPLLLSPIFNSITTLDSNLYGSRPARPVILLGRQTFSALFGDGSDIRAFMSKFTPGEHAVQATGKQVAISLEIEEKTAASTYNVAGVIRGTDPDLRDEAVVYTAHYDALGLHNSEVYPGAADNALGVAEMIEIADAIRESGVRPRRSIVFLAVGAEERGMLGTLHWMRNPTWPVDRVVANINMDGGDPEAWGPLHGVVDLTRGSSTLGDVAAEIGAAMDLPVMPNDGVAGGYSDFYDFMRAGIPAIQLMGLGGDPALSQMRIQRFGGQRVHQPGDVIDEGWNWAGPRQMAQLYLLLGLRVANADEPPSIRERSTYVKAKAGNDQ